MGTENCTKPALSETVERSGIHQNQTKSNKNQYSLLVKYPFEYTSRSNHYEINIICILYVLLCVSICEWVYKCFFNDMGMFEAVDFSKINTFHLSLSLSGLFRCRGNASITQQKHPKSIFACVFKCSSYLLQIDKFYKTTRTVSICFKAFTTGKLIGLILL